MNRVTLASLVALAAGFALSTGGVAAAADPGDAVAGKKLFGQQCRVCHQVMVGAGSAMGPNLGGFAGKPAASDTGFDYSPALRAAGAKGLKWDMAGLDRFLTKPQAMVPGTLMPVAVANAKARADLVAYLATLTP